jgi:hypothetical protein
MIVQSVNFFCVIQKLISRKIQSIQHKHTCQQSFYILRYIYDIGFVVAYC